MAFSGTGWVIFLAVALIGIAIAGVLWGWLGVLFALGIAVAVPAVLMVIFVAAWMRSGSH